jgi:hypothetical protein
MEPVSFYEIVLDEGEYPYRKGGHLSWLSRVFLVESCHCILGARRLSPAYYRFAAVFHSNGLRFLPRYRNAFRFQWGIFVVKILPTPRVRDFHPR